MIIYHNWIKDIRIFLSSSAKTLSKFQLVGLPVIGIILKELKNVNVASILIIIYNAMLIYIFLRDNDQGRV